MRDGSYFRVVEETRSDTERSRESIDIPAMSVPFFFLGNRHVKVLISSPAIGASSELSVPIDQTSNVACFFFREPTFADFDEDEGRDISRP